MPCGAKQPVFLALPDRGRSRRRCRDGRKVQWSVILPKFNSIDPDQMQRNIGGAVKKQHIGNGYLKMAFIEP
jgi:hypothetical protein